MDGHFFASIDMPALNRPLVKITPEEVYNTHPRAGQWSIGRNAANHATTASTPRSGVKARKPGSHETDRGGIWRRITYSWSSLQAALQLHSQNARCFWATLKQGIKASVGNSWQSNPMLRGPSSSPPITSKRQPVASVVSELLEALAEILA
uniref:Uncharacterized protein n=1 Tax=Sphaerodactylus townsendi TaxID=933632 RepID=A0ACB8EZP3_9SAUR